jgi:hypothetical protein
VAVRARVSAWSYLLCYALWAITLALGLVNAAILRIWVREGYVRAGFDRWGFAAADQAAMIVIVLALLGGTLALEYYYRRGVAKGKLWARFRVFAGVLLVVPAARLVETLVTR